MLQAHILCIALLLLFAHNKINACPHLCSGNGKCLNDLECQCNIGYTGADCSLRDCPKDYPWFAAAIDTDLARAEVTTCSSMGTCDPLNGICTCYDGFHGRACQKMKCPNDCNGKGKCMSMREAAAMQDDKRLFTTTTYTEWDADRIHGCVCDEGFTGYDCSEHTCIRGADPLWPTTKVDEKQVFACTATGGNFKFKFRGETTEAIGFGTTTSGLVTILGKLQTINVTTVSVANSAGAICDADGATFTITFVTNPGDLPTLEIVSNTLSGSPSLAYDSGNSVQGTKTNEVCNNRGTCGQTTGICGCYAGFTSSNGQGATGNYGDCGYNSISLTACPGSTPCNGHGVCSGNPNFRCTCYDGWMNGECSQRTCPYGIAWFDEATGTNKAHAMAECSSQGICDRQKGECTCAKGFEGQACERLSCPKGGDDKIVCSGFGDCVSLAEAALRRKVEGAAAPTSYGNTLGKAATWDANKIYGCMCNSYRYIGRSDYLNYDCSLRGCPYGDNPKSAPETDEIQVVKCIGTGGTFQLTFRGETTGAIPYNAVDEGSFLKLSGTATITTGSNSVTTSANLASSLAQNDVVQIETYFAWRNYTVNSVSSNSITFTEPVGLRAGTSRNIFKVVPSIRNKLEELESIGNVRVSLTTLTNGAPQACAASPGVEMRITFLSQNGDVPPLSATTASLTGTSAGITIFEKTKGTTEDIICANQGLCNYETGLCNCFHQMTSSDGQGNAGTKGDCGFKNILAKGDFDV
jgi:hypothetical protein